MIKMLIMVKKIGIKGLGDFNQRKEKGKEPAKNMEAKDI
jgi:hypothetical protein